MNRRSDLCSRPKAASLYFFYFYPLGLSERRSRQPWLTMGLSLSMVVVFLWTRYFPYALDVNPHDLVFFPGNGHTYTLLTAIFLHSDWLHLLGNLIYFQAFGAALEDRLGRGMFFVVFLILGLFGNLVHGAVAAVDLFGQYGVGVLGASGAIAGLLGFSLVRFRNSKVMVAWWLFAPLMGQNKAGRTALPTALAVGVWLLLQVVHSLVAREIGASVSFGAHFGGFFMGLILALALGQNRLGKQESYERKAREYFRLGDYHAAVGEWTSYLECNPGDDEARLELARTRILTDQREASERTFRRIFRRYWQAGRVDEALEVFAEARRAGLISEYRPEELAQVAHYLEKSLSFRESADTWAYLFGRYPQSRDGQRALVRLVMLHMGKLQDREALQHWIETARQNLSEGGWRAFLAKELREAGEPGATENPDLPQEAATSPVSPGS